MLTVLFSRDRAMQLDATLRSFYEQCDDAERTDVKVLYSTSSDRHARQYQQVLQAHAHRGSLTLVRERDFRQDLLRILADGACRPLVRPVCTTAITAGPRFAPLLRLRGVLIPDALVLFLVDDNLFVRRFRLEQAGRVLLAHPDALGFSLRLGTNTTYCYALDRAQRTPEFSVVSPGILGFSWPAADADFAYPLEISSSVYRLADLLPLVASLRFRNPNTLESELAMRTALVRERHPRLLSYDSSVTFCNPVNKVQTEFGNRAGSDATNSSEGLADLFHKGYRIDVGAYAGMVPSGCHEEIDLRFVESAR